MPAAAGRPRRFNSVRAMLVSIVVLLIVLCIVRGESAILLLAVAALALEAPWGKKG